MFTYKTGNKVNAIIRAYCAGKLGSMEMKYDNQPYTELTGIQAVINFADKTASATTDLASVRYYNASAINSVQLRNVPRTNKILRLIYNDSPIKLASRSCNVNCEVADKLYLPTDPSGTLYQVFVYGVDGQLVAAFDQITRGIIEGTNNVAFQVGHNYKVFYSYEVQQALSLDQRPAPAGNRYNNYISLDLLSEGNINDSTYNYCVHVAKAAVSVNKNVYFRNDSINTIDLNLHVIQPTKAEIADGRINYIAIR